MRGEDDENANFQSILRRWPFDTHRPAPATMRQASAGARAEADNGARRQNWN